MTIDDAERYLFNPHVLKLVSAQLGNDVGDLVHLGTELEDVKSLMPDKLSAAIDAIEQGAANLLKSLSVPDVNKWAGWL